MIPAPVSIPGDSVGDYISDALYRRGWSLTAARKTCMVGGMLLSSVITLSAFTSNLYLVLTFFSIAYGSLGFAAPCIWSLPGDVAPTPDHVGSIGGIQNFASNLARIVITTFTGAVLALTNGSFTIPLCAAGVFCLPARVAICFLSGRSSRLRSIVVPCRRALQKRTYDQRAESFG